MYLLVRNRHGTLHQVTPEHFALYGKDRGLVVVNESELLLKTPEPTVPTVRAEAVAPPPAAAPAPTLPPAPEPAATSSAGPGVTRTRRRAKA